MKKSKNMVAKLVFFTLSFIIGVGLSLQLNMMETTGSGQSVSDTAAHLQVELANIRDRKSKTEAEISGIEEKIRLLKDSQVKTDEVYENMRNEIDRYELQAGLTRAEGPGITIDFALSDKDQFELLMANFDLLLSVVNKLNASGAEGIAINEERVIFSTDLRYEQGVLLVNGNPVGSSIQIRAIGDPDTLEATLNMKYGILWEMKNNFNINSKIEKKDKIRLPRYAQEIIFRFAEVQRN